MSQLQYINIEETESTNNYAANLLAEKDICEGTVISAKKQSKGRGQRGNNWESEEGKNIALSIVLKPTFLLVENQFLLSKAIALAVREFVEIHIDKKHRVSLKWPNDIYVNDKKIAGILIENTICGTEIYNSIIGIGININQIKFTSNAPNPLSLAMVTGKTYDLSKLQQLLCEKVMSKYLAIKNNLKQQIDEEYLQHLYKYNCFAHYTYKNETIEAKIIGIEESGRILLQQRNKAYAPYDFSEIKMIVKA